MNIVHVMEEETVTTVLATAIVEVIIQDIPILHLTTLVLLDLCALHLVQAPGPLLLDQPLPLLQSGNISIHQTNLRFLQCHLLSPQNQKLIVILMDYSLKEHFSWYY